MAKREKIGGRYTPIRKRTKLKRPSFGPLEKVQQIKTTPIKIQHGKKKKGSNLVKARAAKAKKRQGYKTGVEKRRIGKTTREIALGLDIRKKEITEKREHIKRGVDISILGLEGRKTSIVRERDKIKSAVKKGVLPIKKITKTPYDLKFKYAPIVISQRGRPMAKGITDPFAKPPKEMPQSIQDYFLTSRAIRRMGYDEEHGVLKIVFQTGYGYLFFGVPVSVWHGLQFAPSKGRFFMTQIYGHWTGRKGSMTYHPNYRYTRIQ